MKVLEAPEGLQPPSVCFLCEHAPRQGDDVVDVERSFYDPGSSLDGRKYVCIDCVAEMARLFDYSTPEDTKLNRDELTQAKADRDAALAAVDLQEAIKEATARIAVVRTVDPKYPDDKRDPAAPSEGDKPVQAEPPVPQNDEAASVGPGGQSVTNTPTTHPEQEVTAKEDLFDEPVPQAQEGKEAAPEVPLDDPSERPKSEKDSPDKASPPSKPKKKKKAAPKKKA